MVTPEIPAATRRAALLLHALSSEQRQRVMARLRPGEVATLQPLLAELTQMGIPADLGRDIDGEPQRGSGSARRPTPMEDVARLNVEELVYALMPCAPSTVAALLRSAEWPWKAEVLDRLGPGGRAAVLGEMAAEMPRLAPSALLAMCEQMCLRVSRKDPAKPLASQAASARSGFGVRVRKLLAWNR